MLCASSTLFLASCLVTVAIKYTFSTEDADPSDRLDFSYFLPGPSIETFTATAVTPSLVWVRFRLKIRGKAGPPQKFKLSRYWRAPYLLNCWARLNATKIDRVLRMARCKTRQYPKMSYWSSNPGPFAIFREAESPLECRSYFCQAGISNIESNTSINIVLYHVRSGVRGGAANPRTFTEPGALSMVYIAATIAKYQWIAMDIPLHQQPINVAFLYAQHYKGGPEPSNAQRSHDPELKQGSFRQLNLADFSKENVTAGPISLIKAVYGIFLSNLQPNRTYGFQVLTIYNNPISGGNKSIHLVHVNNKGNFHTGGMTPSAPGALRFQDEGNTAVLRWTPPEQDGGYPIKGYSIQYKSSVLGDVWHNATTTDTNWMPGEEIICPKCVLHAKVSAITDFGESKFSTAQVFKGSASDTSSPVDTIAGSAVGVGIFLALIIALASFLYRRFARRRLQIALDEAHQPKPIILPRDLDHIPKVTMEDICIIKELGEGNFGKVYEGCVCLSLDESKAIRAAFKTLRNDASEADRGELIQEALTMRNLDHPNVVRLLGLCIDGSDLWLVLEMMDGGDLLAYLRSMRPGPTIPSQVSATDLLRIASAIANGCAYLESLGYIHRDLAARNCLVNNRDPSVCDVKISDFGLTRGVYQKFYYRLKESSVFPIRWTAPEVLRDHVFGHGCDVWSYGILLWELMTLGDQPYGEKTDMEVIPFVQSGNTLKKPSQCTSGMFAIMSQCWTFFPHQRPSFMELLTLLEVESSDECYDSEKPYMRAQSRLSESYIISNGVNHDTANRIPTTHAMELSTAFDPHESPITAANRAPHINEIRNARHPLSTNGAEETTPFLSVPTSAVFRDQTGSPVHLSTTVSPFTSEIIDSESFGTDEGTDEIEPPDEQTPCYTATHLIRFG